MLRAAIMLLTISLARPAFAESEVVGGDKSLGVAMGLSLGGTLGGLALAGAVFTMDRPSRIGPWVASFGLTTALVMPSAGHWYARDSMSEGTLGGYLRIGGCGVFLFAGFMWLAEEKGEYEEPSVALEEKVMLVGAGIVAAGALVDIALLPRTVRLANRTPSALRAHPIALGSSGGFGFGLSGTF